MERPGVKSALGLVSLVASNQKSSILILIVFQSYIKVTLVFKLVLLLAFLGYLMLACVYVCRCISEGVRKIIACV